MARAMLTRDQFDASGRVLCGGTMGEIVGEADGFTLFRFRRNRKQLHSDMILIRSNAVMRVA